MQSLIRSKSAGVTGGRGTAGAGPGRDLLYLALLLASGDQTKCPAGPSDLTDGAEAHTLALFLHGHGNIIIQEIQMKKII